MRPSQQPEDDQVSLVTQSQESPLRSILKPEVDNHNPQSQITSEGKEVDRDSQGEAQGAAPPDRDADQAVGPRCTCSQRSLAPSRSAPALGLALTQRPSPTCKASSHWPASTQARRVVFSDVVEVSHNSGLSVFTLHTQEDASVGLFVAICEEGIEAL